MGSECLDGCEAAERLEQLYSESSATDLSQDRVDWHTCEALGVVRLKLKQWNPAADAFNTALSFMENLPLDDYESTRAEFIRLFSTTELPRAANNVAWTVSLAPVRDDQTSVAAAAITLAKMAVDRTPEQRQFYLNTLGAAYYRNGQYDEAIGWLEEARRISWINDSLRNRIDRTMKDSVPETAGTIDG